MPGPQSDPTVWPRTLFLLGVFQENVRRCQLRVPAQFKECNRRWSFTPALQHCALGFSTGWYLTVLKGNGTEGCRAFTSLMLTLKHTQHLRWNLFPPVDATYSNILFWWHIFGCCGETLLQLGTWNPHLDNRWSISPYFKSAKEADTQEHCICMIFSEMAWAAAFCGRKCSDKDRQCQTISLKPLQKDLFSGEPGLSWHTKKISRCVFHSMLQIGLSRSLTRNSYKWFYNFCLWEKMAA